MLVAIIREMASSNFKFIFPEEFLMVAPTSYTIYTANLNWANKQLSHTKEYSHESKCNNWQNKCKLLQPVSPEKPVVKGKQWVLQSVMLYHRNAIISTLIPLPRYSTFIHTVLFENNLVDFVVTVALCPFHGVSKW